MHLKAALVTLAIACYASPASYAQQSASCQSPGSLSVIAQGKYKGRAFDLLRHEEFRQVYESIVAKEGQWVKFLDGPSPENRKFAQDGSEVIIFSSCKAQACREAQLYGAIDANLNSYAVLVIVGAEQRVLGKLSPNAEAGIKCARALDETLAKRALEQIRKDAQ